MPWFCRSFVVVDGVGGWQRADEIVCGNSSLGSCCSGIWVKFALEHHLFSSGLLKGLDSSRKELVFRMTVSNFKLQL